MTKPLLQVAAVVRVFVTGCQVGQPAHLEIQLLLIPRGQVNPHSVIAAIFRSLDRPPPVESR